jgi:predicted O-methyltransferase YrrM
MRGLVRRALYKRRVSNLETVEFAEDRRPITTPQFAGQRTQELLQHCITSCDKERIRKVWNDHTAFGGAIVGAIDLFDIHILCGLIKTFNVKRIMECSPNYGWSTTFIQMALPEESDHRSFDIDNYKKTIRRNVARHTHLKNWLFVEGDFRKTVVAHLDFLKELDLLFIDSDHSASFAAWYLEEAKFIERVKPGTLIHIHDVYPLGLEPAGFSESPYVLHWLERHRDQYDVISNYEMSRCREIQSKFPIDLFLGHGGVQATNPTLWLRVREGSDRGNVRAR